MKQLLFTLGTITILASSCTKKYNCLCSSKSGYAQFTTTESLGPAIRAANAEKALNKCKNSSSKYKADPDNVECEVLELQ